MSAFIFDGTSNVTAGKNDTVVITASPSSFTQVVESGGNVVFTFGGSTLTITGTTYGPNTTQYPNVVLAGGTFSTASPGGGQVGTSLNLLIGVGAGKTEVVAQGTGTTAIFGGLGVSDPNDGPDNIRFGGTGSFLVFGNGGGDQIQQNANPFDSTSFVTVFGGGGKDTIEFFQPGNTKTHMALYGGEGGDRVGAINFGGGNVALYGGQGPVDPTDGNDEITFFGGGNVTIYGNAGLDTIDVEFGDTTGSTTIFGGKDADRITVEGAGFKSTVVIYGGENVGSAPADQDEIIVLNNTGTTVIFGGTGPGDSADGADRIRYFSRGTATIYGNGGDDTISVQVQLGDSASATTVFAGMGKDIIFVQGAVPLTGTYGLNGNEGADIFAIGNQSDLATSLDSKGVGIAIGDFAVQSDTLSIQNGIAGGGGAVFIANGGSASTQQQALNLAAASNGGAQGTVSVVAFQGSTYVVVNGDGNATFGGGQDLAVRLTGVIDLAGVSTSITIV